MSSSEDKPQQTVRDCNRCIAKSKKTGHRCKNRTCIVGPYCWIHLRALWHLRVKPSTIPNAGLGLFADAPGKNNGQSIIFGPRVMNEFFHKVGVICPYSGERLNEQELDARYEGGWPVYAFKLTGDNFIDPQKSNAGAGRYANDCRNSGMACNAKFSIAHQRGGRPSEAWIKATKPIHQGEEILLSYGAGYWKNHGKKRESSHRSTRNSKRARN